MSFLVLFSYTICSFGCKFSGEKHGYAKQFPLSFFFPPHLMTCLIVRWRKAGLAVFGQPAKRHIILAWDCFVFACFVVFLFVVVIKTQSLVSLISRQQVFRLSRVKYLRLQQFWQIRQIAFFIVLINYPCLHAVVNYKSFAWRLNFDESYCAFSVNDTTVNNFGTTKIL